MPLSRPMLRTLLLAWLRLRLMPVLAALALPLVLSATALAQQQELTARVELSSSRVYVGESFRLQLIVEGARRIDRVDLPSIPGIESRYDGGQDVSRSSISIINGRRTEERFEGYIMQYTLVASREGRFTIPSIEVLVNGRALHTEEIIFSVVPPAEDRDVKLRIEVDNPNPYVGEPIRLRIILGLARDLDSINFSIPGVESQFLIADEQTFVANVAQSTEFKILGGTVTAVRGKATFDNEEFTSFTAERIIIPRETGRITIGPATVDCNVILRRSNSIFQNHQMRRTVVASEPLTIDVKPLPTEGRPPNFNGLVAASQYRIRATASPTEVNIGDPINLEITVLGSPVSIVPSPALERQASLTDGFRVAAETTPPILDGTNKVFQRILRAQSTSIREIPPIELPYFDAAKGKYNIARSDAIPIKVRETKIITASDAEGALGAQSQPAASLRIEDRAGGIRFNYEGPDLLRSHAFDLLLAVSSPAAAVAIAAPPLIASVAGLLVLARRRNQAAAPSTRRKRALAEALRTLEAAQASDSSDLSATIARALREYTAAKFSRAAEGLTSRECADLISSRAPDHAGAVSAILERCDAAIYGGMPVAEARQLAAEAADLLQRLDPAIGGRA